MPKRKTLVKSPMKRVMLMLMTVLVFGLSAWCQKSSVMMMGEACLRSSNIPHVKTMLSNEGLTVNKTSELNNSTNVVYENNAESSYDKLFIVVDKYPNTKSLKEIKFLFPASGKFYKQWSMENKQWGYKYAPNGKNSDEYREVYSNGNGQYMGVNLNNKGWIELTFYK